MKVAIIGSGASGLISAGVCANLGNDVTIFESNEKSGKKIYITGKGRCNITNACSNEEFLKNVVTNSKFLYSCINRFSPYDTMEFFINRNVPLKIERGNRVFPESDKASDITKALESYAKKQGVKFKYNHKVLNIKKYDKFVVETICGIYNDYDCVICCTGGKTYSATGSTGDGYKFAKNFGHNIIKPVPALIPIVVKDSYIKELEGLSLKNVKLNIASGKKLNSFFGEMLFTSRGISGPIVLSASSFFNREANISLSIDLKPALSEKQLNDRLLREFDENKNMNIANVIKSFLPTKLIKVFLMKCGIESTKKINSVTQEDREQIIKTLKSFELSFLKFDEIDYGIVTSGGVDVKEINPKTMESKLVKGLYFAGEILDVDALTGGFNLQIALSTGFVAGHVE